MKVFISACEIYGRVLLGVADSSSKHGGRRLRKSLNWVVWKSLFCEGQSNSYASRQGRYGLVPDRLAAILRIEFHSFITHETWKWWFCWSETCTFHLGADWKAYTAQTASQVVSSLSGLVLDHSFVGNHLAAPRFSENHCFVEAKLQFSQNEGTRLAY